MSLRLNGSTSGYVEIDAPAAAGNNTLTLPDGNGTSGQVLSTNGSGALSWQTQLTRGTVAATTSGTQVDFTSLPTGIRKITLVLDSFSVNDSNNINVRLSTSSTFATTGYVSSSMRAQNASTSSSVSSTGAYVIINNDNASRLISGSFTWYNITGNVWVMSGNANTSDNSRAWMSGGRFDLGGTLDGLRLFSPGTFDNGQVNIFYEV